MGTNNSRNPAYLDNGKLYRDLSYKLQKRLHKEYNKAIKGDSSIAHDHILAKLAIIECFVLSNVPNYLLSDKNEVAKYWAKRAFSSEFFNTRFDELMMQGRSKR